MRPTLNYPNNAQLLSSLTIPYFSWEENMQSTLLSNNGNQKGKKRTLTLINGDELDLTAAIPLRPQAMRLRIIELEDELTQQPQRNARGRMTNLAPLSHLCRVQRTPPTKADDKKRKMQVKKVFDRYAFPDGFSLLFIVITSSRLKKECKSDNVKFQGCSKTIKFDEVYEQATFGVLFGGKGLLIQPTPQNKPKSAVTIIHFVRPLFRVGIEFVLIIVLYSVYTIADRKFLWRRAQGFER